MDNTIRAHLQRQMALLELEHDFEKEEYKQHSEIMGVDRKVRRGLCWYPASLGRSYYNALNQLVVEVTREAGSEIDHQFEHGRPVCFFSQDASGKQSLANFVATVSYAETDRMVVALPDSRALASIQARDRLGVQLYFDETTYRLMFDALRQVMAAKGNRLADLRDKLLGGAPLSTFTFSPISFPWLNASQQEAVNRAVAAKDAAVVHGPPGTGKTTTMVEAVCETLRRETQALVCAQSNMAVDWISEKLLDRGVRVLRIGNPTRVNDKMLSFTFERRMEDHPDYPQLWSLRKAVRDLREHGRRGEALRQKIESLKDRASDLENRITTQIFDDARVIACTLAGSANRLLWGRNFGTLFIDEAAQALEAACWIAIPKAHRVILAGDHCQLPPTIKSVEALRGGLGTSLMQTIVERKPDAVSLLKVQYRMNEAIMRFSSDWFYGGSLQPAPEVAHRGILDLETPIEWIDTDEPDSPGEETVGDNYGRVNKPEAEMTVQRLKALINRIGRERFTQEKIDIGLISPYKAQVHHLRRIIKADSFFKPYREAITVNTVDGFQGQERDVIVVSLVRANDAGQIGFLRDLRRMNVAMTRARMKLIIMGNAATLTRHPFYRRLYQYCREIMSQ